MTSPSVQQQYHVVWSNQASERAGTPLLVLLHGHGANERDLFSLTAELPGEFTVAALRAPVELAEDSYTWFDLYVSQDGDTTRLDYSSAAARESAEDLWAWIDQVRAQHSSVTLLGFSMGMAMATSLLRGRPEVFAAVVGLSGFAVDPGEDEVLQAYFDDAALAEQQVPFFWGRDQADPVISADRIDYTHSWATQNVDLTKVLYTGAGHGIVPQEVGHVSEFLRATVLGG